MISIQKIQIRINKFLRNLFFHLIFWESSFLFYTFLTGENQIFKLYFELLNVDSIYIAPAFIAAATSIIFTFLDIIFTDRVQRFFPIQITIILKSILYIISVFVVILITAKSPITVFSSGNYKDLLHELPIMNIHFIRFLIYFYLSTFFNSFIKGMIKKIGRANFRNWILGLLNKPREQERIFMFIDMKDSTKIAEELMHKKFSHLVQDVFNDIAIVDNYRGEIYQYLGDGAIISWDLKNGLKRNNFLKAFFAFKKVIKKRKRYYKRKYNRIPQFKAGIQVGKVMVLQVGQIRKDISYNGDTLNTAARIESKCNEYGELLISSDLYNILTDKTEYKFTIKENIKLKGKKKGIDIYKVSQKNTKKQKQKKKK
ncbi:MAG: adenylate/guanylate cyclase domain-containing protein [Bacteroidota bacterium]|nr:adenylate/guanylate cyclase domain-containing protein [Bacteroidota bacterium]